MYLFKGLENDELLAANKRCDLERLNKYLVNTPPLAVDLFKKLVIQNPKYRINAREALNHPWFNEERVVIDQLLSDNDKETIYKN